MLYRQRSWGLDPIRAPVDARALREEALAVQIHQVGADEDSHQAA